ncbi:MAG: helix-turn-helix transcriptional regulator [Dokdonella sp.]|nr:MAG: helix-turn-helix transcriptional regulator [Dokdonella sp.]
MWQRRERTASHLLHAGDGTWDFHGVEDLMSPGRLVEDPVHQAYREAGLGWQIGTAIPLTGGNTLILSFERELAAGRHDPTRLRRLAGLRPHLQRAASIAAEASHRRALGGLDVLGTLAVPAALLERSGRVVGTNPWMTPLLLATRAGDRALLGDAHADAQLAAMLRGRAPACTIAVPARPPHPARIVQLTAVTGAALDLFVDDLVVLVVNRVDGASWQPAPALLCALHDLSPAESRLAAALADGSSLALAAQRCGIRTSTARAYLEQIFRKTNCHRQAELVSLLAHLRPFAAPVGAADDAAGSAHAQPGVTGICQ